MRCSNPACINRYRYKQIAFYARRRYVDGVNTIVLLCDAKSEGEKALIILASLLDLDDGRVRELIPGCSRKCQCRMLALRDRLRAMIAQECGGAFALPASQPGLKSA